MYFHKLSFNAEEGSRKQVIHGILGKYEFGDNVLGLGANSPVIHGININTHEEVAIKVIPTFSNTCKAILQEVQISMKPEIRSAYIAEVLESIPGNECVYIVMKIYKEGDLRKFIESLRFHKMHLPESKIRALGHQILSGLAILEKNGILHRDLKPENLLFKDDGTLCITDFGISIFLDMNLMGRKSTALTGFCGSMRYSSPEQLEEKTLSTSSDVFSVGTILYELVTGDTPFAKMNVVNFSEAVRKRNYQRIPVELCSPALAELIMKMLEYNPADRPAVTSLLSHPAFSGVSDDTHSFISFPQTITSTSPSSSSSFSSSSPPSLSSISSQSTEEKKSKSSKHSCTCIDETKLSQITEGHFKLNSESGGGLFVDGKFLIDQDLENAIWRLDVRVHERSTFMLLPHEITAASARNEINARKEKRLTEVVLYKKIIDGLTTDLPRLPMSHSVLALGIRNQVMVRAEYSNMSQFFASCPQDIEAFYHFEMAKLPETFRGRSVHRTEFLDCQIGIGLASNSVHACGDSKGSCGINWSLRDSKEDIPTTTSASNNFSSSSSSPISNNSEEFDTPQKCSSSLISSSSSSLSAVQNPPFPSKLSGSGLLKNGNVAVQKGSENYKLKTLKINDILTIEVDMRPKRKIAYFLVNEEEIPYVIINLPQDVKFSLSLSHQELELVSLQKLDMPSLEIDFRFEPKNFA